MRWTYIILGIFLAGFLCEQSLEACTFTHAIYWKKNGEKDWKVWQKPYMTHLYETSPTHIMANFGYRDVQGALFWFTGFVCKPDLAEAIVALETNQMPMDNEWDTHWQRVLSFDYGTEYEFTYTILDKNFLVRILFSKLVNKR